MRIAVLLGMAMFASTTRTDSDSADAAVVHQDVGRCEALIGKKIQTDRLGEAIIAAHEISSDEVWPRHCRVQGTIRPGIRFEVRLPETGWNGRYLQLGCGGFCGQISFEGHATALADGFALAANDMGHSGEPWHEPVWGRSRDKRRDFGVRSAHVTALAAKAVILEYYGAPPRFSYFTGCSTGGREGLGAAQQFPGDFDGIIAGAPAFPARAGGIANNWDGRHLVGADGKPLFSLDELRLLHRAVITACDDLDGLHDGILADPRLCRFDPQVLACTAATGGRCLSETQIRAARAIYRGAHDSAGTRLYPGSSQYGSELDWDGPLRSGIAQSYLRYLGFPMPAPRFDIRNFDWDRDPERLEAMARLYDPVGPYQPPRMAQFQGRGGKIIAYQGWADPGVPPEGIIDFRARLAEAVGGTAPDAWFRLFMFPGMGHCGGGHGPNSFDFLPLLVEWVENGLAPNLVVASQFTADGSLIRIRPVFFYPWTAKLVGVDPDRAESWALGEAAVQTNDKIDWLWGRVRGETIQAAQ